MKYTRKLISSLILFIITITLLPTTNSIINISNAAPQSGFFEDYVPIHGAYLQTINCDPRYASDGDQNGVLDAGYKGQYVEEPLIVDLEANGFYEGEKIMISHKQSIKSSSNQVWYFNLFGLFSSSSDLLTTNWDYTPNSGDKKWPMIGPDKRVPGAIDVSLGGYNHPSSGPNDNTNTWKQGREVENDIPEDFQILGHFQFNEGKNGDPWTQNTYAFNNWFWVIIPPGAKYLFFQVVSFWSLSHDGYCIVTIDKDSDSDSLPDSWEINGKIDFNKDETTDLTLPDASFERKDLYVEIDYMSASGSCPGHKPNIGAITDVQLAFAMAPRDSVKNPDGSDGINLHIDTTNWDGFVHREIFQPFGDFQEIKQDLFGTESERNNPNSHWILLAKMYTHRYCMFIHHWIEEKDGILVPTTASGLAEGIGCNDFLVSLGSWSTNPGTRDEQAATFMHELGHTLGLRHGGGDSINYKPNYLSIMNYLFTFDSDPVAARPLDYSRIKLNTLIENELDELNGLGVNQVNSYGRSWYQTAYMYFPSIYGARKMQITLLMPIDWNGDEEIEQDVWTNINDFRQFGYESEFPEELEGYNDWANLDFYFQDSDLFAAGAKPGILENEITYEIVQEIREAWNQFDPLPIPSPDPTNTPSEPSEDLTSLEIYPILGAVVAILAILLITFLIIRKRKN